MAHQITLSDEDYTALMAAANQRGTPIDMLLHEAITARFVATPNQQLGAYEYPSGELDSSEDEAEDEHLAASLGAEEPWLSEMIIDDRGPC